MQLERGGDGAGGSYTVTPTPEADVIRLREQFARDNAFRIGALLGPRLLDDLRGRVRQATFAERDDADIARESCMDAPAVLAQLTFLVNDPRFVDLVRAVSRLGDIGMFAGRVYRFAAGARHFDSWHDDVKEPRRIAMSLNLSDGPVEGGELKLRPKRTTGGTMYATGQPGDALLFRVHSTLEHQVQPVRSATPRTALAGWFDAGPAFRDLLAGL